MITTELFVGLLTYYFVMFMTPGPNNAMLALSGIKFGFRKTIPHMIGIPLGHTTQILLVCFGLGTIFQQFPEVCHTDRCTPGGSPHGHAVCLRSGARFQGRLLCMLPTHHPWASCCCQTYLGMDSATSLHCIADIWDTSESPKSLPDAISRVPYMHLLLPKDHAHLQSVVTHSRAAL